MKYYTQEEFVNGIKKAFKSEEFLDYWATQGIKHLGLKLTQEGEEMVLRVYYDKKKKTEIYEEFRISLIEVQEQWEFEYSEIFNVNSRNSKSIQRHFDFGTTSNFAEILKGIIYYFHSRY